MRQPLFVLLNFCFCIFIKTIAMKCSLYCLCIIFLVACNQKTKKTDPKEITPKVLTFSENIEEAHNKTAFREHEAIAFHIKLNFGGSNRLDADIRMTTNSEKVRLDRADGASLIYNGKEVYLSPSAANDAGARFDIFTWQYFFALPFKLTDPGTVWEDKGYRRLDGRKYETSKLTFISNTGDSPDDWYLIYKDPETSRLKAAAYIVTFSKEKEEAEKNPHLIVYSKYKMIEGVAFASKWKFYNWNEENGLGKLLGEAEISNIHFFENKESLFKKPSDYKLIKR